MPELSACDIMTSTPAVCTKDHSVQAAAELMYECDCGFLPVVDSMEQRQPIGTITDRDIICRAAARGWPAQLTVNDCMSAPCVTVTLNTALSECCELMGTLQIRRLVVVDGLGRCCGVVALADIARAGADEFLARLVMDLSLPTCAPRHLTSKISVYDAAAGGGV